MLIIVTNLTEISFPGNQVLGVDGTLVYVTMRNVGVELIG